LKWYKAELKEFTDSKGLPKDGATCDCKQAKKANYKCYLCGVKDTKDAIRAMANDKNCERCGLAAIEGKFTVKNVL